MHSTPPTSIEPPDDKAVIELISPDRLNPYLTACAGDTAAALALYRWNSDFAAAFFEPLGHLEIMLRNALDARLVARQQRRGRTIEWYTDTAVPLSDNACGDIAQARQRAGRNAPVIPRGKIIAELSFGFWRFLLARQYKTSLWPDLAGAFPHAPVAGQHVVDSGSVTRCRWRSSTGGVGCRGACRAFGDFGGSSGNDVVECGARGLQIDDGFGYPLALFGQVGKEVWAGRHQSLAVVTQAGENCCDLPIAMPTPATTLTPHRRLRHHPLQHRPSRDSIRITS
jgi:hypothetical protein